MSNMRKFERALLAVALMMAGEGKTEPLSLVWTRQISTRLIDYAAGVSADGLGNVYITGEYGGPLPSPVPPIEAFTAKYNSSGTLQWLRRLDTPADESGFDIAADPLGNIFVLGETFGSLFAPNPSGLDFFVINYDPSGNQRWAKQFDAFSSGAADLDADGLGNVYVAATKLTPGQSSNVLISKYDSQGGLSWSRELGTLMSDSATRIDVDSAGNIFVVGETTGDLHGVHQGLTDVFVSKLDANSNVIWSRQLGTSNRESASSVAGDGLGNVYVLGSTYGVMEEGKDLGEPDGFLAKFDRLGNKQWVRQFGSNSWDVMSDLHADEFGNIYVTASKLFPSPPDEAIGFDVWKFDTHGNLDWTQQIGNFNDFGGGLSVDKGAIYIAGSGQGTFGGDPKLWKYFDSTYRTELLRVPEPSSIALGVVGVALAVGFHRIAVR